MNLTLTIKGKKKEFSNPFISAMTFRKFLGMAKRINFNDMTVDQLDEVTELVVDAYGNRFTLDELYDGMSQADYQEFMAGFISLITGIGTDVPTPKHQLN